MGEQKQEMAIKTIRSEERGVVVSWGPLLLVWVNWVCFCAENWSHYVQFGSGMTLLDNYIAY